VDPALSAARPAAELTRLTHIQSGTTLTPGNFRTYVSQGVMYDEVGRLASEHIQGIFEAEFDLVRVAGTTGGGTQVGSVDGCWVPRLPLSSFAGLLVVVPGKGKVQAGIWGRELCMSHSIEEGSALLHLREARARGWGVVLLNPNAKQDRSTFVQTKLGYLSFDLQWREVVVAPLLSAAAPSPSSPTPQPHPPIFVLAHSQAGAQVAKVRPRKPRPQHPRRAHTQPADARGPGLHARLRAGRGRRARHDRRHARPVAVRGAAGARGEAGARNAVLPVRSQAGRGGARRGEASARRRERQRRKQHGREGRASAPTDASAINRANNRRSLGRASLQLLSFGRSGPDLELSGGDPPNPPYCRRALGRTAC
jgi:hypothetical protein